MKKILLVLFFTLSVGSFFVTINLSKSVPGLLFFRPLLHRPLTVGDYVLIDAAAAGITLNQKKINIKIIKKICAIDGEEILVCGDHEQSFDSRYFGKIQKQYAQRLIRIY